MQAARTPAAVRAFTSGGRPGALLARRHRTASVVAAGGLGDMMGKAFAEGKKAFTVAMGGQYDQEAVRAKVEAKIAEKGVVVFSWTGCPFCKKAKALLDDLGAKYEAVELDTMGPEGAAIRAELAKITGRTSVPQTWIGGQFVGGCNDGPGLLPLHAEGKLKPMLEAAGAL